MRFELPVLLAARLFKVVRVVFGPDHNLLRGTLDERMRDVGAEGCKATLVRAHTLAVHPHHCLPVHRFEMHEQTFAWSERLLLPRAAIPDSGVEPTICYAAGLGLRAERDEDVAIPCDLVRQRGDLVAPL